MDSSSNFENELLHYGTPRHSGRYPWGSGEEPYQHPYKEKYDFLTAYRAAKRDGLSEKQIADKMGLTVDDLRKKNAIASAAEKNALIIRAQRLKAKGLTNKRIGEIMGGDTPYGESTVRGWLKQSESRREETINNVVKVLEKRIKAGEMVDVGYGSELSLGVTKTTFDTALKALKDKGYVVDTIDVPQPNLAGAYTKFKVLAPEGTTKKDMWVNRADIQTITEHIEKGTNKIREVEYPQSVSLDRVAIRYTNDDGVTGGVERDGLVEIRRNVKDLSMGNSSYAQVRIAVDDKYYIKGMAIYSDNIPDGYDILVNSNKTKGTPIDKVLKVLKDDKSMPFGATVTADGQNHYIDDDGKEKLGCINKLKWEGQWDTSNKALSSQFLSKQPKELIKKQLDLTYKNKADEYNDIMLLTNEVVKRKLLQDFAEGCDKDAKHLQAAALPRQNTRVLIPIPELRDTEVYAPTYKNGETLVLVRFPHGGTFEIPTLTVNNRNKAAKNLIGNAADAIGINKNVANRLSGADFDGDFVLTIPVNDKVRVQTKAALEGLKDFDPSAAYPGYPGMRKMTSKEKGIQMGIVSNLITDMTLRHATPEELTRAVKHSMVVIDAEKHELDWRASERDNAIDALKRKYQKNPDKKKGYGGASTLISKAEAELKIDEIQRVDKNGKKTYTPDPETGEWHYGYTGRTYRKYKKDKNTGELLRDADGNPIYTVEKYKTSTTYMDMAKDARTLSSGTIQENLYADYANNMKALANRARKQALDLEMPKADPVARKTYANEVESLESKLKIAKSNKPLERAAQLKANVRIEEIKEQNPDMPKDKLKKEKNKALTEARINVGAGKQQIEISDREWEAIQAHAISPTKLSEIINNSDMDKIRKKAQPRESIAMPETKIARMKAMDASGLSIAEIADSLGYSTSTISKYLKGDE